MKSLILILVLTSSTPIFGQLTIFESICAKTGIAPCDGDGTAQDACSEADCFFDIYNKTFLQIGEYNCDCTNGTIGFPSAESSFHFSFANPPSNVYPAKSYLGYTLPFGFEFEYDIDNSYPDYVAGFTSYMGYGTNMQSSVFNESAYIDLNTSTHSGAFSMKSNLILPKGSYAYLVDLLLASNACGDQGFFGADLESSFLNVLLPSQFYSDNGLVPPTFISFPANPLSRTFPTKLVCVDDIYLENVALDSYTYSAAGDLSTSSKIVNNSTVVFCAGNSVNLEPGFIVELGSSYTTAAYSGCIP